MIGLVLLFIAHVFISFSYKHELFGEGFYPVANVLWWILCIYVVTRFSLICAIGLFTAIYVFLEGRER